MHAARKDLSLILILIKRKRRVFIKTLILLLLKMQIIINACSRICYDVTLDGYVLGLITPSMSL